MATVSNVDPAASASSETLKSRAQPGDCGLPVVDEIDLQQMSRIIRDLYRPNPRIYWTDFLLTLIVGGFFTGMYLHAPAYSFREVLGFFIAGLALFLVGSFIHEIVHLRSRDVPGFITT